jgi:tight adherence protein C
MALIGVVILGVVLMRTMQRDKVICDRLDVANGNKAPQRSTRSVKQSETALVGLRRVGTFIISSGILSPKAIKDLETTLTASGRRPTTAMPLVVGSKVILMAVLPLAIWLAISSFGYNSATLKWFGATLGSLIGMTLPNLVINRMRSRYLATAERGLPDALDLLVICADAGLPLETAIDRVASEITESDASTSNELTITSREMKMLPDRRMALKNMGTRTGLDSLITLGGTLAQTLKYGTPLTQALRVLSDEMRHTMLVRFEAKAAKLPVLLTLPTIALFLPCIILIVIGPAAVRVYHMMHGG